MSARSFEPWHGPVNNAQRFEIQNATRRVAVVDMIEDARLITAAPDLLDALLAMVDEPQPGGISRPAYQAAITAISKATRAES